MEKGGYIYILTNKLNTVLYVGVTSNLQKRVWKHRSGKYAQSFTKKYNINKLVYFEFFQDIESAIQREKQLKAGSRAKKIELIEKRNPGWEELYKYGSLQ